MKLFFGTASCFLLVMVMLVSGCGSGSQETTPPEEFAPVVPEGTTLSTGSSRDSGNADPIKRRRK